MNDVIQERQENLNAVETIMNEVADITKTVNKKVKEQRTDLVEITDNTQQALENAEEAEENIEKA